MTHQDYRPTTRTTPARNRQRITYDAAAVHAVLDEGSLCHVGFVVDARPVVLPQLYVRIEDQLYLHASTGAGAARLAVGEPIPVCVTVTLVDGLVLARSAFNHSMNYRSVVVHGLATLVVDAAEKDAALTALVDAVLPGRSQETRGPDRRELAATAVLRVPLVEVSLKVRSGPPVDDEADLALPYWAGVLPLVSTAGTPVPDTKLDPTLTVPDSVRRWTRADSDPTR